MHSDKGRALTLAAIPILPPVPGLGPMSTPVPVPATPIAAWTLLAGSYPSPISLCEAISERDCRHTYYRTMPHL